MNSNIENFIGRFDNAFDDNFCQTAINYYESMTSAGFGFSEQNYGNTFKIKKDSKSVGLSNMPTINARCHELSSTVLETIWTACYKMYVEEYAIIPMSETHSIYEMKIQKTLVGGGYHEWHYESSGREHSRRLLNYQIYLNDVKEGGETEFLYYSRREKPKAGTLLIYPCSFTHTHRGNPPLSNEKYILNGWIEF